MGYYINELPDGSVLPAKGKATKILSTIEGSKCILKPDSWQPGIVCVVDNGPFEAAAYCYNERELMEFAAPDGRPKTWLIVPGVEDIAK